MKKDQLTCTKGTKNKAIAQTISFTSLPHFKSMKEAKEFIQILFTTCNSLEKKVANGDELFYRMKDLVERKTELIKRQRETIEKLLVGEGNPGTFEAMRDSVLEKEALAAVQSEEIKELKKELKKSRKFHYLDFILN